MVDNMKFLFQRFSKGYEIFFNLNQIIIMNCSYRPFENNIGSVGYDGNSGYYSPYTEAYSQNPQSGRLTAGMTPNLFDPFIPRDSTVSDIHAMPCRICDYDNGRYDGEYESSLATPIAAANAQTESLPPETKAELPPPSDSPEPSDLTTDEQSAITKQPVVNEDGTVSLNTEENPLDTIKDQESFIYNRRMRGAFRPVSKITPAPGMETYVAPSRRTQLSKERFTTELNGLKDSQYLHEAFLDSKKEQEQSNAIALVVLTICFFIITLVILWNVFGCCDGPKPSTSTGGARIYKPSMNAARPLRNLTSQSNGKKFWNTNTSKKPQMTTGGTKSFGNSLSGGSASNKSSKLSGSIF